MRIDGETKQLVVEGDGIRNEYDPAQIDWPERTRTSSRILRLPDGSTLHAPTGSDWRDLARESGAAESRVVQWQQSKPRIFIALCLVAIVAVSGYIWGVPLAARAALAFVPEWVDEKIGQAFMESVSDRLVGPSTLDKERQAQISERFAKMVQQAYPQDTAPKYKLSFHKSKVGPNAFALPGGQIIMTDQLVELADNDEMVLGVLGHELGHVEHRHGMRMVSQSLIVGLLAGLVLGDYADLIASVPLVLGQAAYSRKFERESDEKAIMILKANDISPVVMADFFRKLRARSSIFSKSKQTEDKTEEPAEEKPTEGHDHAQDENTPGIGIMLSSHPTDAERIARFEKAAKEP